MKWFFCLQINTKVFYKMILSFWVCATRVTQSTQNNKFAISSQYLKENGKNEVYFLLVDKHQKFLQIDTIILGVCGQACPNYQNNKFAISLQYLKKEVSVKVDFLHADKHESFLQIDSVIFYGGWSSIPKEPKISLRYFCNISRKTRRMKLIFCLQINIKGFFKLILSF